MITYPQIPEMTKRYGFKTDQETWDYLESIGLGEDSGYWQPEMIYSLETGIAQRQLTIDEELMDYVDEVYWQSIK